MAELVHGDADNADYLQRCLPILQQLRGSVADYQEKKGIPKTECYTFYSLVMVVGQNLYSALVAMGYMMFNLVPILDAFLLIARFMLDKVIEILQSDETDRPMKVGVFMAECIPIIFILCFIYGFIVVPLLSLCWTVFCKFWSFIG